MNFPLPIHPRRWFPALMLVSVITFAQAAEEPADDKAGPKLRMICVSSLEENQELVLASKDTEGKWSEYAEVKLRSSFISDWLPAATGTLHLATRSAEGLVSKCTFKYPEGARRAILVLLPDVAKQRYQGDVIDPAKLTFAKGSTLLVNYSSTPGVAMLGTHRGSAKPGERVVMKPKPGDDGMYRMLVAYQDAKGELVPCYDRYIPHNEKSRDFLLLFPDPVAGLRVFSLAEFGPFE